MSNKRIDQLACMLADITKINIDDAKKIIINTHIGEQIQANNPTVLYEQQTENLSEIASELKASEKYRDMASMLTDSSIVRAGRKLHGYEAVNKKKIKLIIPKNSNIKKLSQKQAAAKHKAVMKIQMQNKFNSRRIENADKFTR